MLPVLRLTQVDEKGWFYVHRHRRWRRGRRGIELVELVSAVEFALIAPVESRANTRGRGLGAASIMTGNTPSRQTKILPNVADKPMGIWAGIRG